MSEPKEQEEITQETPTQFEVELQRIDIEQILLPIRVEWKKALMADKDSIKDSSLIGNSKLYKDCKFPFTVKLYTADHFIIFFKLNLKSQIIDGETTSKMMATYLSRKTWKKDILKLQKKTDD